MKEFEWKQLILVGVPTLISMILMIISLLEGLFLFYYLSGVVLMLSGVVYLITQKDDFKGLKYILSTYVAIVAFIPIINVIIPIFFFLTYNIED